MKKAFIISLVFFIFYPFPAFSVEKAESPASTWLSGLNNTASAGSEGSYYYTDNLVTLLIPESKKGVKNLYDEWPIRISPGIRGGNGRALYYMDAFVPFFWRKSYLFFANPRVVHGSNRTQEVNIGVGVRQLLFEDKMFLGINGYFDTQRSENNFRHNQLGAGAEAIITRWFDLRTNFYFPVSGKRPTGTTTYTFEERSFLSHHTTSSEEPLKGLDYEGGVLIPFISKLFETRAYIGGYHYDSKVTDDIDGIKGRVEVRPIPLVTVNAEVRDDNAFDTDLLIGGYLNIPLSFKGWKKLFKPRGARTPRERMTDMVVRDIDVFTSNRSPGTDTTKVYDMVYVDNTNNTGIEDGSKTNPYNTVTEGLSALTDNDALYIYEGSGNYTGNFTVSNTGAVIWGEGYEAYPGAGGGGYPVLDANSSGSVLTVNADNVEVMGLKLQNSGSTSSNAGLSATDRSGGNIHHNIMDDNYDNIYIAGTGGTVSNWTIANNTLTNSVYDGIYIDSDNGGTLSGFTIRNNTITGSGDDGIDAGGTDSTFSDFTISNNTITGSGDDGIYIFSDACTLSGFTFSGNNISNNDAFGIEILGSGTFTDFTFTNNMVSGNGLDGIGVYVVEEASGFTISNNTLTENDYDGIYVYSEGGTLSDFTISNNTITGSGEDGISVEGLVVDYSNFTISNNTISGSFYDGINILSIGSSLSGFTFSGNTTSSNGDLGIGVYTYSDTLSDFTFSNNISTENAYGIYFDEIGSTTFSSITFGQNSEGNSIYSNTTADFYEDTSFSFTAEQNYWGGGAPTLSTGFDDLDYTPYLTTDPN